MLVLALQFSRGESTRDIATRVAISTLVDQTEEHHLRDVRRGRNSLKTEEKTMPPFTRRGK
jgi:hypothetical protein